MDGTANADHHKKTPFYFSVDSIESYLKVYSKYSSDKVSKLIVKIGWVMSMQKKNTLQSGIIIGAKNSIKLDLMWDIIVCCTSFYYYSTDQESSSGSYLSDWVPANFKVLSWLMASWASW